MMTRSKGNESRAFVICCANWSWGGSPVPLSPSARNYAATRSIWEECFLRGKRRNRRSDEHECEHEGETTLRQQHGSPHTIHRVCRFSEFGQTTHCVDTSICLSVIRPYSRQAVRQRKLNHTNGLCEHLTRGTDRFRKAWSLRYRIVKGEDVVLRAIDWRRADWRFWPGLPGYRWPSHRSLPAVGGRPAAPRGEESQRSAL